MQFWLDTIDLDAIAHANERGVLSGVTTNPSILSTTSSARETLLKILEIQSGPVAVQVTSSEPQKMIEEGLSIFEFSPRLIVKIPVNSDGLIAIEQLHKKQVPVLGTGILYPTQALLASNLGASYISPYFGHIGDIGDAFSSLKTIVDMFFANQSSSKILVASLKQLDHIIYCATLGITAVTLKRDLYYKLVANQPVSEKFFQKFSSDWKRMHGESSITDVLASKSLMN